MSHTQFVATSSAQVEDTFNLVDYMNSLAESLVNEKDNIPEDILWEISEDFDTIEIVDLFERYLRVFDDKIYIECDSEERNGNSMIWDWLCDQVRKDVMISNVMEIHSATIDSRSGVDTSFGFYKKDGTWIGSDDMVKLLEDNELMCQ